MALISSGDAGVYGMAGPTYEVLFQAGWTPNDNVTIKIIPGASALNSCAALVGAPLTHDFCAISLSDLLTPWPAIARRLEAAAATDFITALYNPKSGRRTRQIVQAQRIFLRHRSPETSVVIVKSAWRRRQHIAHTTLAHIAEVLVRSARKPCLRCPPSPSWTCAALKICLITVSSPRKARRRTRLMRCRKPSAAS